MKLMTLGFRSRNEDIDTTKHHPKKADLSENFLQHCIFFICGHWAKQLSSAVLNTSKIPKMCLPKIECTNALNFAFVIAK